MQVDLPEWMKVLDKDYLLHYTRREKRDAARALREAKREGTRTHNALLFFRYWKALHRQLRNHK